MIRPRELQLDPPTFVREGARMSGEVGHALFALDRVEHEVRAASGRGAVTALHTLNYVLEKPDEVPPLWEAPLRPPGLVLHVEVRAEDFQRGLDRAVAFRAVAPVTLLTPWPRRGFDELVFEADALGIGLKVLIGDVREAIVEPSFTLGLFDAATWAFHERAYRTWLKSGCPTGRQQLPAATHRARSAA